MPPAGPASFLKVLGMGASGTVWLVAGETPQEEPAALKVVSRAGQARCQASPEHSEEALLARCSSHPAIVRFFGASSDLLKTYILTEACLAGDMLSLIRARKARRSEAGGGGAGALLLPEPEVRSLSQCIASALGFMHSKGIMFRDLKPENLLCDGRGKVKLVDFGLAKPAAQQSFTLCGTAEYVAPEVITMQGHGCTVDWWGLGVCTYELLHGHTPFSAEGTLTEAVDVYRRITHPEFKVSYDPTLGKSVLSFLKRLMRRKPASRLGAAGTHEVEGHVWLQEHDDSAAEVSPPWIATATSSDSSASSYSTTSTASTASTLSIATSIASKRSASRRHDVDTFSVDSGYEYDHSSDAHSPCLSPAPQRPERNPSRGRPLAGPSTAATAATWASPTRPGGHALPPIRDESPQTPPTKPHATAPAALQLPMAELEQQPPSQLQSASRAPEPEVSPMAAVASVVTNADGTTTAHLDLSDLAAVDQAELLLNGNGLHGAAQRGANGVAHGAAGGAAHATLAEPEGAALLQAVNLRTLPEVLRLLREGVPPDSGASAHGTSALMQAAELGLDAITVALLAAGADPTRRNSFGETALDLARARDHKHVICLLPGGSHDFSQANARKLPCAGCNKVVGLGRDGLFFCSRCFMCHACGLYSPCEPENGEGARTAGILGTPTGSSRSRRGSRDNVF